MNKSKGTRWSSWFRANMLGFAFSFGLLAAASQLVDLLGAHGPTFLGLVAHISAIFLGGAVLGFLQQQTLDLSPLDKKRWLLISPLTFAASFIGGEIAGGLFFGLAIGLTLFGLLSGLWQSIVLRNYTKKASLWIVISAVGFAAGAVVASAFLFTAYQMWADAFLEFPAILLQALIGIVCGSVAGTITGFGLNKLFP